MLYAVVALLLGLFGLVEVAVPDGVERRVLEIVVIVLIFGGMAIWLRVNRSALAPGRRTGDG